MYSRQVCSFVIIYASYICLGQYRYYRAYCGSTIVGKVCSRGVAGYALATLSLSPVYYHVIYVCVIQLAENYTPCKFENIMTSNITLQ